MQFLKATLVKHKSIVLLLGLFCQFAISCKEIGSKKDMVLITGTTLNTTVPYTSIPKKVNLQSFYIDKYLVTYKDYNAYADSTGYITEAEKFGNSVVFNFTNGQWEITNGINFHSPHRAGLNVENESHPVTQISWNDAKNYCECMGKRLPTEFEWELAAKNGDGDYEKLYSWGDHIKIEGKYQANYWQGSFPYVNTGQDGFKYTSPVGHFGPSPIGLFDMGGNVWEWCSDDIAPTKEELDLGDPAMRKVLRGGSFLCDPEVCHGYRTIGRSSSTPETASNHVGFRCVRDI